jgi:hypothetical protein
MCRCGHVRDTHSHYRRGSDCAGCDCPRYQRGFVLAISFRAGLPTPVVVIPDEVHRVADPYVRPTHTAGTGGVPRVPPTTASLVVPPRDGSYPAAPTPVVQEQAEA